MPAIIFPWKFRKHKQTNDVEFKLFAFAKSQFSRGREKCKKTKFPHQHPIRCYPPCLQILLSRHRCFVSRTRSRVWWCGRQGEFPVPLPVLFSHDLAVRDCDQLRASRFPSPDSVSHVSHVSLWNECLSSLPSRSVTTANQKIRVIPISPRIPGYLYIYDSTHLSVPGLGAVL